MHSKTIKESNLEQYEAKLRAFMSKAGNRDYIKPDEFHSLQRESMGMDTILKDCDYFITKEGVEIKLATTKYTGRKIKTLVSKVPSIPNPLPPTAFDGYTVVSSQSFDSYIRTKTAIPTHKTAHWVQGPFDGVCIKEDGFWFARWGEFSNGVKVVSFAMMPTQRYTEDPEKQFNQSKAVEHDSMQSLRDAKYDLISMSKFDGFASEGFFRSGPFAYTSMGDHDGKKDIVTKHCGRLKSGVVVAAFDRKPFVEPEQLEKPKPFTVLSYLADLTKYVRISEKEFKTYHEGNQFIDGPYEYWVSSTETGSTPNWYRWGTLKGGFRVRVETLIDEKPKTQLVNSDDWEDDDDDDDDEGESTMIVEKPKATIQTVGPDKHFRMLGESEKLVVMVRVAELDSVERPKGRGSNSVPCVVVIDGRKYDGKGIAPFKVGTIRWLLPFTTVETLELTEKPEFTIDD